MLRRIARIAIALTVVGVITAVLAVVFTDRTSATWSPVRVAALCGQQQMMSDFGMPLELRSPETYEECLRLGAHGINVDHNPQVWASGVDSWEHVQYSIDGGAWKDELDISDLAPGPHTLRMNDITPTGDGSPSDPYHFTAIVELSVAALCEMPADPDEEKPDLAECWWAAQLDPLRASQKWGIYAAGVRDMDNLWVSVDGDAPQLFDDWLDTTSEIAPGDYTLQISERRGWGWAGWSDPYAFTVDAVEESE